MRSVPICILCITLTLCLLLAGCADRRATASPSDPASTTQPTIIPSDFWLTATVVGPARAGGLSTVPRDMRPARYVMEADHQLRAAIGTGGSETSFPPATRRLTTEQVAELWRLTNANGLMNADHPAKAPTLPVFDSTKPPTKTMYIIVAHANGKRRVLLIDAEDPKAPGRAEAQAIVDRFAEWAWLE